MNFVGIEIIIAFAVALALSCIGFIVHGRLLQREVRRTREARRLRLAADLPVAAAPRPATPSHQWEAETRARLRKGELKDDEIAALIAESEAIATERQLSGSRASRSPAQRRGPAQPPGWLRT